MHYTTTKSVERDARRRIVTVAWQMVRAGRINPTHYQTRIDRANERCPCGRMTINDCAGECGFSAGTVKGVR